MSSIACLERAKLENSPPVNTETQNNGVSTTVVRTFKVGSNYNGCSQRSLQLKNRNNGDDGPSATSTADDTPGQSRELGGDSLG